MSDGLSEAMKGMAFKTPKEENKGQPSLITKSRKQVKYKPKRRKTSQRGYNPRSRRTSSHPNAKLHQITSFIKSGIRIIGYGFLPFNLALACGILIVSEVVGIIEELV